MTAREIYDECEILTAEEAELLYPEVNFDAMRVLHDRVCVHWGGASRSSLVYGLTADGELHGFVAFNSHAGAISRVWDGSQWNLEAI